MVSTKDILKKYSSKLESDMGSETESFSKDYLQFKQDMTPPISRYEGWAKSLGSIINMKIAAKDRVKIEYYLERAHLDMTPSQAVVLAGVAWAVVFFASMIISVAIYLITLTFPFLFAFLGFVTSMFVFYYAYTLPQRKANEWMLKASSQMVPAILYLVVYMKHTSNLERAVRFASEHLEGPLALDFKKIFYNVEIGKFSTIKQALDNYLESWREYAPEFVESFHLVESSLYEPSDDRRMQILEKALQVILDGIYEKMLKYSREIRSPLTNIYMLGIILPTLGLALLPLASTLLGGILQWYHVMVLFNIIVPFLVFYMTSQVLLKRPGGYGDATILELNPLYPKFISRKPWIKSALIVFPFIILGLLPFIFQVQFITSSLGLQSDYTFAQIGIPFSQDTLMFDFKTVDGSKIGPFGPIGVLLSLLIPLSIALFFSMTYKAKTREIIKSKEDTKLLEDEFTSSLFQLGNRLGDGIPAEIAFAKVAEATRNQKTHDFFALVNQNIQQSGMSLDLALFDKRRGAIVFYPSSLIATSMRILVESVKKGLQVAARSLMSISEYVKNIEKINQRLRDLLAEVVSDMRSNMTFLAPLLAGVVVGLSAMITMILNKLQSSVAAGSGTSGAGVAGLGSFQNILSLFDVTKMIPPYFMQVIIGLYIIEIIFILTTALVTVDSGKDILREKYDLSRYLKTGVLLYITTALVSIVALVSLSAIALGGM